MNEKLKKETPIPSRLRGRGVEVSKTLFYVIFVLQSEGKLFIMKGVVITGKKEDWYDQHCDCGR